jgi:hypothetical protein
LRDYVAFTSKRIVAVNVQGMTGKDFTSLPYSKIQAFSIESAGTFDLDAELELWFSGLGKVKFEFKGKPARSRHPTTAGIVSTGNRWSISPPRMPARQ